MAASVASASVFPLATGQNGWLASDRALGGWNSPLTVMTVYQQADQALCEAL